MTAGGGGSGVGCAGGTIAAVEDAGVICGTAVLVGVGVEVCAGGRVAGTADVDDAGIADTGRLARV